MCKISKTAIAVAARQRVNLQQERAGSNEESDDEEIETREFSVKELEEMFIACDLLKKNIVDGDQNLECSMRVSRDVFCYKVMYDKKKKKSMKQRTLLQYFK